MKEFKYMRVVAYGLYVFVQTSNHRTRDYEQNVMTHNEFATFMQDNFPTEWAEYLDYNSSVDWYYTKTPAEFFYNYGLSEEEIRKGEAFIFENRLTSL